jgi:hypothetical protein
MAFTGNFTTNTFLVGLLDGTFDFGTGTTQVYKIALYTNAATLDATTTAYTSTGEASGGNYAAGGQISGGLPSSHDWQPNRNGYSLSIFYKRRMDRLNHRKRCIDLLG